MTILALVVEVIGDLAALDRDVVASDVDRGTLGVVVDEAVAQGDVVPRGSEHHAGGNAVVEVELEPVDDPVAPVDTKDRGVLHEAHNGPRCRPRRSLQYDRSGRGPAVRGAGAGLVVGAGVHAGDLTRA